MRQLQIFIFIFLCFCIVGKISAQWEDNVEQIIIVTTDNWESNKGVLRLLEKTTEGWEFTEEQWSVVIGRSGLAWGKGSFSLPTGNALQKQEGDGKSPAGIFKVSPMLYGYAENPPNKAKLNYTQVTDSLLGIDDSKSKYYNKIIDTSNIESDWDSFEYMKRKDDLYKWVLVIEHNTDAVAQGGSCIFIHLWRNSSAPTSGCTAMTEENILKLIDWIDPQKSPHIVQLPKPMYQAYSEKLQLPQLPLQEK